jgi:hypothetical protein
MATDQNLYTIARAVVKPSDIESALPHLQKLAGTMTILNGRELRVAVERFIQRSLLWEEWLDVRQDWCRVNHAYHCDAVLGDSCAVERCAQIGRHQGCDYLLLEIV